MLLMKTVRVVFKWLSRVIKRLQLPRLVIARASLSTNEKENQNQSPLTRAILPALWASHVELLRISIGSLRSLHLLWLVEVITYEVI